MKACLHSIVQSIAIEIKRLPAIECDVQNPKTIVNDKKEREMKRVGSSFVL